MLLEEWLRRSAVPLAGSVVVVAISLAVRLLAHRLQVADPGSPPIAALRLFDVNSERNVPTGWSVALLLSAVALAGSLAVVEDRSRAGGWALVTLVSAALALDEWFALHERLGALGAAVAGDALHFAWVVPGALVAGVVGLVLLTALRGQPPVVRRRLSVCGLVHLTGALGLETVSGAVLTAHGDREGYVVVTALEEGLEMAGVSLLLGALLLARESALRRPAAAVRS